MKEGVNSWTKFVERSHCQAPPLLMYKSLLTLEVSVWFLQPAALIYYLGSIAFVITRPVVLLREGSITLQGTTWSEYHHVSNAIQKRFHWWSFHFLLHGTLRFLAGNWVLHNDMHQLHLAHQLEMFVLKNPSPIERALSRVTWNCQS